MRGYGSVSLVPTGWDSPGGGSEVRVLDSGRVECKMGGRAYFADTCTAGTYDHKQYVAHRLLGKTIRYTTDMSAAGCGCNAAFYLTSLHQNTEVSTCNDYYCDANKVCGVWCAEIDIQEANQFAWHSTLHTAHDRSGVGAGYGGGGKGWSGPRQWTSLEYGPGKKCIDASRPFQVAASFPVDGRGILTGMEITLSQEGRSCPLSVTIDNYAGMAKLSRALDEGMTPILSYWKANDMLWMDGKGQDGEGPCRVDHMGACPESIQFYNFSVAEHVAPAAAGGEREDADGEEGFCCMASSDSSDFCGKCFPGAMARRGSHCGRDRSSCRSCGSKATWCQASSDTEDAAAANQAASDPEDAATAGEDGYCCLAAPSSDDVCGTCFPGARAKPGTKCGGGRASCHACGGRATWCEAEEGHCCLAAADPSDHCGTCFAAAVARPSAHCGGSARDCASCGGRAQWCKAGGAAGKSTNTAVSYLSSYGDAASPTTKGNTILHVEASNVPANLVEGMELKVPIGDAPPMHVKVVKMS